MMIGILSFAVGCVFGWVMCRRSFEKLLSRLIDEEIAIQTSQMGSDKTIDAYIERHDDVLFAYAKKDGTFLAQGADVIALDKALVLAHPGVRFIISADGVPAGVI